MRIAVFGASGMLGSTFTKLALLDGRFSVVPFSRINLPGSLSKIKYRSFDALSYDPRSENFDYVVNCCGAIKQKRIDLEQMYGVNAEFPRRLAKEYGPRLTHISTDCVFSGEKGLYVETDAKDCKDDYGKSKSEGEDETCKVFRTSIIGTHPTDHHGLLEWCRNFTGGKMRGYVDHYWGGVTTLRLSQKILGSIGSEKAGLTHVYSDRISKLELLKLIQEVFDVESAIEEHSAGFLDRSLLSVIEGNLTNGSIAKQLIELKDFERVKV